MHTLASETRHDGLTEKGSAKTAVSLTCIGSGYLCRGELVDALAWFDAAQAVLTSPDKSRTWTNAALHLELGCSWCPSETPSTSSQHASSESPPDLYEEEECDVGPRILRTPIDTDFVSGTDVTLLKAIVMFNRGLVFHAMGKLFEAKEMYEVVVCSVQNMLSVTASPSLTFMQLAMRSHNNLGLVSYHEGQEGITVASFEAATQFGKHLSSLSSSYSIEYATTLSNWCRVNWMRGDVGQRLYQRLDEILFIRTSALPWDHPDVAAANFNIAVAEFSRHDSEKAVSHILQYLTISKHRCEEKQIHDLDAIPALVFFLLIKHEDKNNQLSQDLVRGLRALQNKRQDSGPNGLEVATILNYVGTLLFYQQDYDSALLFFHEELRLEDIKRKATARKSEHTVSNETNSVSVTCNNIGRILQELGKFHDAVAYYHRALEPECRDKGHILDSPSKSVDTSKWMKSWGVSPDCPTSSVNLYSTVWYNLGLIHDKLASYNEAILAFEMSLNLRKVLLGCHHSDIACLLYNIGVLFMEQNRLDEASASFREALEIRRVASAGQLNDRHIVKTLEKLASLQKDKGNLAGALEAAIEILGVQQISVEYDPLSRLKEMGATMRSVAELHHESGDLSAAVQLAVESVENLRIAAEFCMQQHALNYDVQMETLLIQERIASVEQLVSSLLLLGSLHHENSEPLQAHGVLGEAAVIVQMTTTASTLSSVISTPSSLHALREVTTMLGTNQCAPVA